MARDPRRPDLVVEREPVAAEPELALAPPPPRRRSQLRRALRTLRRLLDDPDSTENAIEFFHAIGTRDFERAFRRFAAAPGGARLLRRRPSLLAALADREALARLPDGSLGRAYLAYLERTGFAPDGLVALERRVRERWVCEEGEPRLDGARVFFNERSMLVHDLEHVLTGYGTDDIGEATLLAFSLAQAPGVAQALLTLGAALDVLGTVGRSWPAYALRAWRRGRRARWLVTLPYEELLALPLETVQVLAGLEPAARTHPSGLLRGRLAPRAA